MPGWIIYNSGDISYRVVSCHVVMRTCYRASRICVVYCRMPSSHMTDVALGLISTPQLCLFSLPRALIVFSPSSQSIFSLHHFSSFIDPPRGLPRPSGDAKVILTGRLFSFGVSGLDKLCTLVETVGERSSSTLSQSSDACEACDRTVDAEDLRDCLWVGLRGLGMGLANASVGSSGQSRATGGEGMGYLQVGNAGSDRGARDWARQQCSMLVVGVLTSPTSDSTTSSSSIFALVTRSLRLANRLSTSTSDPSRRLCCPTGLTLGSSSLAMVIGSSTLRLPQNLLERAWTAAPSADTGDEVMDRDGGERAPGERNDMMPAKELKDRPLPCVALSSSLDSSWVSSSPEVEPMVSKGGK